MKVFHLLIIIATTLFISCSEKNSEEVPPHILEEEKVVGILTDLHVMESVVKLKINEKDSVIINEKDLFKSVYEKHQVEEEEFRESFDYYTDNPRKMQFIFDAVLQNLSKREAELRDRQKKNSKKN